MKFHAFMFDVERPQSLFASDQLEANKCKRDSILSTVLSDWMEWQAGFACGAFLIPSTALSEFTAIADIEATYSKMDTTSREGLQLISDVADYSSLPRGGPCAAAPAANPHGTHRGHQFILTSDDCVFLCPGDLLISRSAYMLIQLQQEQNKMPNQTDHPQTGPDVTITIDNKLFSVHRGNISISELKALGGVPAGYEFEEIVNRILKPLSDGAQLVLKGGEIFVSHPRAGASS